MKTKPIFLLFLLFTAVLFAQAQPITLRDAVNASLKNNEKIQQYSERVNQKDYANDEAWGNFMPSIGLDVTYNHFDNPLEIDLSPIRDVIIGLQAKNMAEFQNIYTRMAGAPALTADQRNAVIAASKNSLNSLIPPFSEELKRQDNKYLTVGFTQPLFTGGKLWAAKKAAKSDLQSAEIELSKIREEVIRETGEAYLNALFMQNVVNLRRTVLANIKQHRNRAQKFYEQGMIPKYQFIRAEAAVAEAERYLTDDSVKFELTKLVLANITGLQAEQITDFRDSLSYKKIVLDSALFIHTAVQEHPYLQIIGKKAEMAHDGFIASRAAFLPTIAAFGKYEFLPEYLSALEPRWVVGLKLQYNLFNGFKDYQKMQTYSHLENEISYIKRDVEKSIVLLVRKTMMQTEAADKRYKALEKDVLLADENLRIANKRFESGSGISLEIIDANSLYEKTRIDRYAALLDYYKSYIQTLQAVNKSNDFVKFWNEE